jgi:hypothetical protein
MRNHSSTERAIISAPAVVIVVVGLMVTGARAETPVPPDATGYPSLQGESPRPDRPAMTPDDLAKLKQDLSAARDRQQKPVSSPQPHPAAKGTTPKIKRDQ